MNEPPEVVERLRSSEPAVRLKAAREIAEILHLAEKTVESHRANAMRKLGMRDRVELVRYAIRSGLVEP